jgi:uncharacterized membrane protein
METIVKLIKSVGMAVVAGVFIMACSNALQVSYDYDSAVNLKQFKTFKVEAERNMEEDPPFGQ